MTAYVTAIVLVAALLHATWNALVKGAVDRTVILGLIAAGHVIPAAIVVFLVPAPSLSSLPYIAASTVIHWGYYVFLNLSYRWGDLSFAYPVARGLAPVLVALGAMAAADEFLSPAAWVGIVAISAGIMTLAAVRHGDPKAFLAAFVTSLTIAMYSIVDGLGIRVSGSPLGYVAWLFLAEIFVAAFVLWTRRRRVAAQPRSALAIGFAGGLISATAYALALYAKTLAPLGIVSALRETSVIFAALIGVLWFSERPASRRVIAAAIVAIGIVILALA